MDSLPGGSYWFRTPNELIDEHARAIGPVAVCVYLVIARHWLRVDPAPFPTVRQIAELVNISTRATFTALERLQTRGLIARQSGRGRGKRSAYILLDAHGDRLTFVGRRDQNSIAPEAEKDERTFTFSGKKGERSVTFYSRKGEARATTKRGVYNERARGARELKAEEKRERARKRASDLFPGDEGFDEAFGAGITNKKESETA